MWAPRPRCRKRLSAGALLALLLAGGATWAADPQRGARLYASAPSPGLLACADCHSADPQVTNFGNIFAGHNALALIQRAVAANTGGMGVFSAHYGAADLADIAAYLGNSPTTLSFASTEVGRDSATLAVRVSSSTKLDIGALTLATEGDFVVAGGSCGSALPRFSVCTVDLLFRPAAAGERRGALLISHDGTPTPVRIALSGDGVARPPAVARLLPERLAFGAAAAALAGPVQGVTVLNDSPERLTIAAIEAAPAVFRPVGGSCRPAAVLWPGQHCTVALRFDPQAGGPQRGTLTVTHDGVGGRSTAALSGRGEDGARGRLVAEPPLADFGSVGVGRHGAPQTFTWRNTGNADWRWRATRVTAPGVAVLADGCRDAGRVAPGRACQVVLAFSPRRAAGSSGLLAMEAADADASGEPPARLPLIGWATEGSARLAASPARLALAAAVGQPVRRPLRLVSRGDLPVTLVGLEIVGADAAAYTATAADGCTPGTRLPPATGCAVAVTFTPLRPGHHQAALRVVAPGGAATLSVPLDGTGERGVVAGRIEVKAHSLDFGELAMKPDGAAVAEAVRTLTVHNAGPGPWVGAAIVATGADAARFQVGGDCAVLPRLEAGGHCSVELRFVPGAAGEHLATLVLQGSDGLAPVEVSLRGRGVGTGRPRLQPRVARLQFAPQPLGAARAVSQWLTVTNEGSAPAPAQRWAVDGPFRIERVDPACLVALPPGGRCTLALSFAPVAPGTASGHLRFGALAAGAGGAAGSVALHGEAVEGGAAQLAWQQAPDPPRPGDARVGGPAAMSAWWTLLNRGDRASAPLALTIAGAQATEFSLDAAGSCRAGQVLAPRAACTLRIAFHPAAAGRRQAALRVQADAAFADLPLEGTGRAPGQGLLRALPPALWFDASAAGSAPPAWLVWRNEGPAALRIDELGLRGDGFRLRGGNCPAPPFLLQPGQACALEALWQGTADGRRGAELVARLGDGGEHSVPLAVSQDPVLRSNVGGGGAFSAVWSALLAWASAALWSAERRSRRLPAGG